MVGEGNTILRTIRLCLSHQLLLGKPCFTRIRTSQITNMPKNSLQGWLPQAHLVMQPNTPFCPLTSLETPNKPWFSLKQVLNGLNCLWHSASNPIKVSMGSFLLYLTPLLVGVIGKAKYTNKKGGSALDLLGFMKYWRGMSKLSDIDRNWLPSTFMCGFTSHKTKLSTTSHTYSRYVNAPQHYIPTVIWCPANDRSICLWQRPFTEVACPKTWWQNRDFSMASSCWLDLSGSLAVPDTSTTQPSND